jgi:hypothetical protein
MDWSLTKVELFEETEILLLYPDGIPEHGRADKTRGITVSSLARINYRRSRNRQEPLV